ARERRRAAQHDVSGWEPQAASELRPVRHAAADRIRMPEKALGRVELALGEGGADGGARYPDALEHNVGHGLDLESEPRARRCERGEVARPPRAEPEVAPDEEPARGEALHQHVFH